MKTLYFAKRERKVQILISSFFLFEKARRKNDAKKKKLCCYECSSSIGLNSCCAQTRTSPLAKNAREGFTALSILPELTNPVIIDRALARQKLFYSGGNADAFPTLHLILQAVVWSLLHKHCVNFYYDLYFYILCHLITRSLFKYIHPRNDSTISMPSF